MNCTKSLIEAVRMEQCLWNPTHPEYREVSIKDAAWQRVVEAMNDISIPNSQIAKMEWKKLRDNHRDALKRAKLGKNKLLPAQITTWKYAKAMQFLEPHMKYRITEHIEMEAACVLGNSNSDHDVSTTDTADPLDHRAKKRPRVDKDNPTARDKEDALKAFFNCIQQSTREMPQWMQTQVKKKIFDVVIEAEEYLSQSSQKSTSNVKQHRSNDKGALEPEMVLCTIKTELEDEES